METRHPARLNDGILDLGAAFEQSKHVFRAPREGGTTEFLPMPDHGATEPGPQKGGKK